MLAVRTLEEQLGPSLLDRSGYRVSLTQAGRSFHERARIFLHDLQALKAHATQLAKGEESEFRVVIGDLCPLPENLALLRRFLDDCPGTRLHLHWQRQAATSRVPKHMSKAQVIAPPNA